MTKEGSPKEDHIKQQLACELVNIKCVFPKALEYSAGSHQPPETHTYCVKQWQQKIVDICLGVMKAY